MSKGMVSVTSPPLRLAQSAGNYVEYGFVFLLLLLSCCLFSSFSSAAFLSLFSAFCLDCIMCRTAAKVQLEERVVAMSSTALRWYECAGSDWRLVRSCSAWIVQQAKLQIRGSFYQWIPYFLLFSSF